MRNSYTAACIEKLIREDVVFGLVAGVSAGASHTANYLGGSPERTVASFVEFANNPSFGGVSSLLKGQGFFNAEFIYEKSADHDLPYDFEHYKAHPADMLLAATRADTGESVYWTREDIKNRADLLMRVRASSTLPMIMPIRFIDGVPYVDGALGDSGGILIDAAEKAGYTKFLFIGSRPRGYVRPQVTRRALVRRAFYRYPAVGEALIARADIYNAAKQRLLQLEKAGKACLFFPEDMQVTSTERNHAKLQANYEAGRSQTYAEWPTWKEFLGA